MEELLYLAGRPQFVTGMVVGVAATSLGWLVTAAMARSERTAPLAVGGLLIGAGAVVGWHFALNKGAPHLVGIGLVAGAVLVGQTLKAPAPLLALLSLPGALWLALNGHLSSVPWIRTVAVAAVPVAGYLVADFDRRHASRGLGPIFFGISVLGLLATVPDTEEALVLAGVVLPIVLLAWPHPMMSLGRAGAYLAVAVFVWTAVTGGMPRPSSIVGALGSLGFLLVEPLVRMAGRSVRRRSLRMPAGWHGAVLAALPHLALVFIASRVAGLRPSVVTSLLIVAAAFTVAVASTSLLSREVG